MNYNFLKTDASITAISPSLTLHQEWLNSLSSIDFDDDDDEEPDPPDAPDDLHLIFPQPHSDLIVWCSSDEPEISFTDYIFPPFVKMVESLGWKKSRSVEIAICRLQEKLVKKIQE